MIKIALVDSGINVMEIESENRFSVINSWKGEAHDYLDLLGHGTKCANLILKSINDVELYNVKVFDKSLSTSGENVFEAMNWCIQNGIQIINLSLSINNFNYYYEFKEICDEAEKKNVIIVASADNFGRFCLPAYLDNVIGVGAAKVDKYNDFYYIDSSIQIYGDASIDIPINSNQLSYSTSFATARMTGIIANMISNYQNVGLKQLCSLLAKKSKRYVMDNIIINYPSIDINKCIAPISIEGGVETIIEALKNTYHLHITNNHIEIVLLVNLTTNPHIDCIENRLKEILVQDKIIFISTNENNLNESNKYRLELYKQIPIHLCSSYGKAIIDNINSDENVKLIIVFLDKPIIPLKNNCDNFFDNYTIAEISLLFGLQVDYFIPIIDELNKMTYLKRNIECMKSLFDLDVPFVFFNSLQSNIPEEFLRNKISNSNLLNKISKDKFNEFFNIIQRDFGLKLYDLQCNMNNEIIYDLISDN